jgi:hypothetical protein
MGYGGYHPFQPSSAARGAQPPLSANGVGTSSTANSGTLPEGVSSVALEASRGD